MTDRMKIGQLYPNVLPPGSVRSDRSVSHSEAVAAEYKPFNQVFREQFVRLSQHAELRLRQRGITLGSEQLAKIDSAIDKAAAKGAKESLILLQDMAFIVNVKNRTVVTAMDGVSMKDNVFTQIDSAVIVS
ncbi:TIGR02530 family flagellar biosynthesis protein [Ferviditalea candida]|uniref:TIGR02530 family flagellar biosynthesis protein n=1 Tax=Ferviditalea candida TaxID=3108399 RepID=A0ABU5ZF90_9BACL|nr:TIGR02530 family flagellar biosynthesis protein [Paenibacillaceae bacterium T2]